MSQIKLSHLIMSVVLALAVALGLAGCGDKNPQAVFSPESGHQSDWTLTHKFSAKADLESCVECHGANLDGGIAKSPCTRCHPAAPGTISVHPLDWGIYAYARHKTFVATNGTSSCATAFCHGADLTGVGTAPNCATKCHLGGISNKHPEVWTTISGHKNYLGTIANVSTSCKTAACHGTDGKGVFLSGPACDQCHPMR